MWTWDRQNIRLRVCSRILSHVVETGAIPLQAVLSLPPAMSKLYVGNIPDGAKEKEIQELFQAFGEVEEVALLRGYGFVHFIKSEDASAALNALDDSEFMGSHIQVQFARTKGHGYGRGSGPPRPRLGRGNDRYDRGGDRGYRDSYRDSGSSYRDSYRESYRDNYRDRDRRYGGGYEDPSKSKDYRRYDDYYDRYDYERYRSSAYDHYPDRYYDDRYYHERDYYGKYGDYRAEYKGRSRSPVARSDYYAPKERSSYYERDSYRDDTGASAYRSRRW